jgi:hypothetical protein
LKKLAALVFATLIIVSALVMTIAQPVNATSSENVKATLSSVYSVDESSDNETIIPGSENGLVVALGGIVGIVLFLSVILLMVLKKRKKNMH